MESIGERAALGLHVERKGRGWQSNETEKQPLCRDPERMQGHTPGPGVLCCLIDPCSNSKLWISKFKRQLTSNNIADKSEGRLGFSCFINFCSATFMLCSQPASQGLLHGSGEQPRREKKPQLCGQGRAAGPAWPGSPGTGGPEWTLGSAQLR